MKIYKKPEIEIVEFVIEDITTLYENSTSDYPEDILNPQSDEVFYGIEAGEEGYLAE